ncbi:MAG: phenylalanine--tRNA ligase subunit beta, partial [Minisyncoccales bacterium]
GIKGGKKAEVSSETKNIFLEGANFDVLSIRKTSAKLNLATDASLRFSYGRDPNSLKEVMEKALSLIKKIAGGNYQGFFDFYPAIVFPKKIKLDFEKTRKLLGVDISDKEIKDILKRLDFKIFSENLVQVPTFRLEIDIQENLMNEIGRIYGFWRIPSLLPSRLNVLTRLNWNLTWERKVKQSLKEAVFDEVITYSFCHPQDINNFFYSSNETIELLNPVSLNFSFLRPSLLINLLKNISFNQRNFSQIRIFELGKIFRREKNKFLEKKMLAGMILGGNFFELKGVIDFILEKMGIVGVWYDSFEATSEDSKQEIWYPSRLAEIKIDHQEIGFLGEISPLLSEKYGVKRALFAFEIDFERLTKMATEEMEYEEISPYPTAIRDISLIVPQEVKVDDVLSQIQFLSPLIRDVDFFDIFEGLEKNKKSLSFHIYFQSKNKTLSDKELDILQEKIIEALEKNKGWKVRKKE